MPRGSAHIDSPEVVQDFRNHFVLFDRACRQALDELKRDIHKTIEWLQREQLPLWQRELRKREEAFRAAHRDYQRARREADSSAQAAALEAKKALDKAKRYRDEAEAKIGAVRKWGLFLSHKAGELLGPCTVLSGHLDDLTPRALARLDRMVESLDEYFRTAPVDTGAPPPPEE